VLVALLTVFFIFGGLSNIIAPRHILEEYAHWGYPVWFHFVTGMLELGTAVLLALPKTRRIGATLGCCVMLGAVATVVLHGEFAHATPGLIVLGLTGFVGWSRPLGATASNYARRLR
jgi:hypothetical protein